MERCDRWSGCSGFSQAELLVAMAVLGLLLALGVSSGHSSLARMRVEAASRRLVTGLEAARQQAQLQGTPCALELGPSGWREPSGGSLAGCGGVLADTKYADDLGAEHLGAVELHHNLPAALRFSSNGLVLDGGTVVVSAPGSELRRCLVMSLPLGVVRLGRYTGSTAGGPSSSACVADGAL